LYVAEHLGEEDMFSVVRSFWLSFTTVTSYRNFYPLKQ